jgi:hypothetical protein
VLHSKGPPGTPLMDGTHMLSRIVEQIRLAMGASDGPRRVRRMVNGIEVVLENTRPEIADEDVFRRMGEVLALVESYAPSRMRRLRRDLAGIEVRRFACRAAFFPESRRALLELTFMVNPAFSIAEIASSLLHEGVHARVYAMGVVRTPTALAKEERLCRRTELWWGQTVPGGQPVVERALASLALPDEAVAPDIDWAEAARRVGEADRAARGD